MTPAPHTAFADAPGLDLGRLGTPEARWLSALGGLTELTVPTGHRVVVLSPHPDDETFGVGGTISMMVDADCEVVVVSLTDGEAASDEPRLAARRTLELQQALRFLSNGRHVELQRWSLPDSGITGHLDDLHGRLMSLLRADDIVLAPFDNDGHGDHDATGRAARSAAAGSGCALWFYPIWAWHWHDPDTSALTDRGVRVPLSVAAMHAKHEAMRCFASQTAGSNPVVPADMVIRFSRSYELLVRP